MVFYGIGLVGALMVCWLPDGVEFIDMAFSLRAYSDIIIVEKRISLLLQKKNIRGGGHVRMSWVVDKLIEFSDQSLQYLMDIQ